MKHTKMAGLCARVALLMPLAACLQGATVTFSNLVAGATSYGFDGDGDTIADVVFSTTDPLGFNTSGPGPFQLYVYQAGLEGTSLLNPDLRVDFLHGATGSIQFGFAVNSQAPGANVFAGFQLFDAGNNLLGSATVLGARFPIPPIQSTFAEGQLSLMFSGRAAYGLFNFSSSSPTGRFFLDNFTGTFGSTESVPEPASGGFLLGGLAALSWGRLRRANRRRAAAVRCHPSTTNGTITMAGRIFPVRATSTKDTPKSNVAGRRRIGRL